MLNRLQKGSKSLQTDAGYTRDLWCVFSFSTSSLTLSLQSKKSPKLDVSLPSSRTGEPFDNWLQRQRSAHSDAWLRGPSEEKDGWVSSGVPRWSTGNENWLRSQQ